MEAQKCYPKPAILEADPNATDAAKQFLHWKRSFENYLGHIFKDDKSTAAEKEVLQLEYLTTYIDYKNFDYISESTKYSDAMRTLEQLFVKPKNEIFARHSLAIRKQKS